jgi:MFS family permease
MEGGHDQVDSIDSDLSSEESSPVEPHDAYAAFRIPSFRHYLAGNFIFLVGLQMQKVALGWEIYERTDSALHLGYVGLAQFAPQLVLAPFGGHVVDAYNRKRVLFAALAVSLLGSLSLALDSLTPAPLWVFYTLLAVLGAARSFWMPARSAILPRLVPAAIFRNAVSWNSSFFELASIGGPALGGLLIALFHKGFPIYLFNTAAALTFVLLVSRLRYDHDPPERNELSWASLAAGFHFLRNTRVLLAAMLLDTFAVLLGGATALMPVYAKDILHVGPRELGWLLAAPSLGAVTAAFLQAHRPPWQSAGRMLLWSVAGYGLVTIGFGLSTNLWLSLGLLVLLGACDNISVVLRGTLVQVLTPDAMRGRVSALNGLFIGTSNELGAFESGTVAQFFGPVVAVVSGGIGTLLVVLGMARAFPELRRSGRLDRPAD